MRNEKGSPEADPGEGGSARAGRLVRPAVLLLWVLSAVVAGSVVWWAVAAIGGEQGGARGRVYTQAQVAELTVPSTDSDSDSDPGATATPSSTPTETSPSPSPTPSPSAVQTPVPVPVDVARTWDVVGGQIGAQCRGPQIALLYATPSDGWTVEVKHGGPEELEVTFRRGESETSAHGACVDGVPSMVAEAESD
ncbi:hypothetical protein [Pengzhenrongella frigida]|uniref:Septum formation initiator n=1 Tax=Pengzhenrongella frigida TaxID=1259133 RepID=A0A4Q5N3H9_9MICO|nr:hypothetical protein [Cellulomonas sp. HLT2-17]RYV52705.1 hypothetical protein EUA98_01820 [Cellulomonas sp. HLT2-17]